MFLWPVTNWKVGKTWRRPFQMERVRPASTITVALPAHPHSNFSSSHNPRAAVAHRDGSATGEVLCLSWPPMDFQDPPFIWIISHRTDEVASLAPVRPVSSTCTASVDPYRPRFRGLRHPVRWSHVWAEGWDRATACLLHRHPPRYVTRRTSWGSCSKPARPVIWDESSSSRILEMFLLEIQLVAGKIFASAVVCFTICWNWI